MQKKVVPHGPVGQPTQVSPSLAAGVTPMSAEGQNTLSSVSLHKNQSVLKGGLPHSSKPLVPRMKPAPTTSIVPLGNHHVTLELVPSISRQIHQGTQSHWLNRAGMRSLWFSKIRLGKMKDVNPFHRVLDTDKKTTRVA